MEGRNVYLYHFLLQNLVGDAIQVKLTIDARVLSQCISCHFGSRHRPSHKRTTQNTKRTIRM